MKRYRDVAIINPGQFLLALELYFIDVDEMLQRFELDVLIGNKEKIPLELATLET